jgi:protein TonB
MAYADQEMSRSRIISIIIVALIHVLAVWLLISGLAISAFKEVVERVTTVDVTEPEEEPEEEPPPPPPDEFAPPPPVVPPAPFNFSPPAQTQTIDEPPPPRPVETRAAPAPAPPGPPPPPPPPSRARGATADGQSRWAARISNNYPSRAVRQEIEGNVGVSVVISPEGRVTACSVSASSGSDILDEAACDGMQRYARYNPALDDAGNPTTGRDSMTIVYQLN